MIRASLFGRKQEYLPIFSILRTKLMPAYFSEKKTSKLRKSRKLRLLICFLVVNMYCLEHLITQIFSQNWQSRLKKNIYWGSNFEINHILILQPSRILPHHLPSIHQVQESKLIMWHQWAVKPLRVCMKHRN